MIRNTSGPIPSALIKVADYVWGKEDGIAQNFQLGLRLSVVFPVDY